MGRHDERHLRADRFPERNALDSTDAIRWMLDERQLEMRIDRRVAMSREMLPARGDTALLHSRDDGSSQAADALGVFGESAIADDGILGIRMNVENGSIVERDPDGLEFRRQGHGKPPGELNVAASAEDGHRWPFGEWRLQTRDSPALPFDTDPQRQARCETLHVDRHLGHLLWRLDVAREKNHAAE